MDTVLVVDDDPDLRDAIRELLDGEGFATIGARNGADAMGILNGIAIRPCLILVDLNMPVMNGWELLAALSADRRWAGVPRLVMTSLDHDLHIGLTPWVHKPFEWGALMSAVREVCPVVTAAAQM